MKFVSITSMITIIVFAIILLALTGCAATPSEKRTSIIQELQAAGCHITSFSEYFGRSIAIKCDNGVVAPN